MSKLTVQIAHPKVKPGQPPSNRIPIYKDGMMVGNVGRSSTAANVSRFTKRGGAKLGIKNGRKAWIG
jgi:hypothetical protein